MEIRSIDFSQFDGQEAALRAQGIRIRPDASSSADLAPEGVTFTSQDELWASLQQNNALAAISAGKNGLTIERLVPLGAKDHSFADDDLEISYGLDASDRDGRINIQNWPVFGFYGPDEIASFKVRGDTYFIITNEGNPTEIPVNGELVDETARVRDLALDPAAFPDAAQLQSNENLGRLQGGSKATATETGTRTSFTRTAPGRSRSWTMTVTSYSTAAMTSSRSRPSAYPHSSTRPSTPTPSTTAAITAARSRKASPSARSRGAPTPSSACTRRAASWPTTSPTRGTRGSWTTSTRGRRRRSAAISGPRASATSAPTRRRPASR